MDLLSDPAPNLLEWGRKVVGNDVYHVSRYGRGGNSRVYLLRFRDGSQRILKSYLISTTGTWSRLDAEYGSLAFLWQHGIRCIPQPFALFPQDNCALYGYIDGTAIPAGEVRETDIDQTTRFLADLWELRQNRESRSLQLASEACFSAQGVVDNIEWRLNRLQAVDVRYPVDHSMRLFLDEELLPGFRAVVSWGREILADDGIAFDMEIAWEERTLSPSDVGFHNVLKQGDGRLIFLDFEHFGWDDPVKLISDFSWHPHPAMALVKGLKERYTENLLGIFAAGKMDFWRCRLEVGYRLFGLKWCTILLNEFLAEHAERRAYAAASGYDVQEARVRQLARCRELLRQTTESLACPLFLA